MISRSEVLSFEETKKILEKASWPPTGKVLTRVRSKTGTGAYYLEHLNGEPFARPWNAEKLKQYYS